MQLATLHLAPILGAEKSRVPFYIAGGALVAWALIVSAGLGLRRADFPGNLAGQRVVMAISAVLVLVAVATAVVTSGVSTKAGASGATGGSATGGYATGASTSGGASSAPRTTTPARPPKATTGTPAPPSSPAAAAGPSVLKLAADPGGQLSYDTKQLSARAGIVTIDFANASPLEHDVTIAQGSKVLGQTPIKTGPATLSLNLKPGTYTFYCAVPGHRQGGMEGTLSVS
jgi:plastocyanin